MVIYNLIKRFLAIIMIILVITIGFKYISGSNISVIEGYVNIDANEQGNNNFAINIDYPEGFNKDNCVPIACGVQMNEIHGYNYIGDFVNSRSLMDGASTRYLNLKDEKIVLDVINPTTETSYEYKYKIVLLKYEQKGIEYTLGDVNGDGNIDKNDLQMLHDYMMGKISLTVQQYKAADIDGDGQVTSADYVRLKNQLGITE